MKNFLYMLIGLFFWSFIISNDALPEKRNAPHNSSISVSNNYQIVRDIYSHCNLSGKLNFDIFNLAMEGYNKLDPVKKNILTIIDFTKPSTKKRMFIIDIKKRKLLIQTYVAHGKNSGLNYATKFSNRKGSLQSSLGFYLTAETYFGKHGYSLMIDGVEKGINDNARRRSVVIHGADYVSEKFIAKNHRLGRSWGCPAVPEKLSKQIIDLIKGGSCLFIYANESDYLTHSITTSYGENGENSS